MYGIIHDCVCSGLGVTSGVAMAKGLSVLRSDLFIGEEKHN